MGANVGTIFVEIDLDRSRYDQRWKSLVDDAKSSSLSIEENFKKLGIKSSYEFDLMRQKATNAFNMIKASSKATANDIVRAEKAKADQIIRINEMQYGRQVSMIEKMKKNWIALSAGAYAAMASIRNGFDLMEKSAQAEVQKNSFANLAASYGANADQILADLKRVSGGTLSTMKTIESAGTAMMLGINPDKLADLMNIARTTAKMTGQTVEAAFSDIARGIGRQSKMILDNLGIIVSVEQANQKYAETLGKASSELTDMEKKQAFLNATVEAGEDLVRRLGEQQDSHIDKIQRLKAGYENFTIWLGEALMTVWDAGSMVLNLASHTINKVYENLFKFISSVMAGMVKAVDAAGTWIVNKLTAVAETIAKLVEKIPFIGDSTAAGITSIPGGLGSGLESVVGVMEKISSVTADISGHFESASIQALKMADSSYDLLTATDGVNSSLNNTTKAIEDNKEAAEESVKALDGYKESTKAVADLRNEFDYLQQGFGSLAGTMDDGSAAAQAFEIAQKAAAVASAVAAVANQGSGDPYTAFARIAAMAATMGALLATIGESLSGGGGSSAPKEKKSTVLGSSDQSESASKSFELLEETYSMEYDRLTGIYNEMKSLNSNISGLVNSILRGSDFTGKAGYTGYTGNDQVTTGEALTSLMWSMPGGGWLANLSGLTEKVGNFLNDITFGALDSVFKAFGSSRTKVTGAGIYTSGGLSIEDIMAGGTLGVDQYADIYQKTKTLGHTRRKKWTEYQHADDETSRLINDIFKDLSNTFASAAEVFGMNAQDALDYTFPALKINLKGLKDADEISDAVNNAISSMADDAAEAIFGFATAYQKAGEGMLDTVTRLATDLTVVNDAMDRIGNTAFTGSTDPQNLIALSESLIEMAGGLDEFASSVMNYYDKFFSETEKQARLQQDLTEQLENLNMALPMSRSGFKALVESLDVTTVSGQQAFVTLMNLSDAADDYYSYLEDAMSAANDLAMSLDDQLRQRTMTDEEWQSYQIDKTYNENVQAIEKLAAETGMNFDYLLEMAAEIRDIDKDALKIQQEQAKQEGYGNIQGIYFDLFSMINDTTQQQSGFRDIEMWFFNLVTQLSSLGLNPYSSTPSAVEQQYRDLIDAAFLRKVEDYRDEILQTQQDLIDSWADAVKAVEDQIYELRISSANPMDEQARLSLQREAIADMLGGMSIEDYLASLGSDSERIDAIRKLQDMYGDILSSAQDMYQRPSSEYQAIYDEIMGNLETLADVAGGYQSQAEIAYEQLESLHSIEELLEIIAYDKALSDSWWRNIPDLPVNADGESSIGDWMTTNQTAPQAQPGVVNFNISIDGARSPEQTGDIVISKVKSFIRSDLGRRMVQTAAAGR